MSKSILIIDDDESVRDAFTLALSHTDYATRVASSGEEGIQQATAQSPDLIFLDLKMPGIDGVETLRRLREQGIECPVYIVTAFMPEFLDQLAVAAKEGLKFGLGQKPLTRDQICMIASSNIEAPEGD